MEETIIVRNSDFPAFVHLGVKRYKLEKKRSVFDVEQELLGKPLPFFATFFLSRTKHGFAGTLNLATLGKHNRRRCCNIAHF
ncbi:hypothetical protein [Roseibium sp. Sym1]|uniref:hypothetical protein n=1 Tax=Roseibium sp. Sym1 TaxID=3016006 RepID=UPI0022B36CF8|nr:hypothetical protein [Roseibium sp. Sym1]